MPKQLHFHSDFASLQVVVGGVPIALHGEVAITITQPTKLPQADRNSWSLITKESAQAITAELIPHASKD